MRIEVFSPTSSDTGSTEIQHHAVSAQSHPIDDLRSVDTVIRLVFNTDYKVHYTAEQQSKIEYQLSLGSNIIQL